MPACRPGRRAPVVASFALASLLVGPARAEPEPPPPDRAELLAEAQRHVNEASRLYLEQDFEGALAALEKAEPLAEAAKDPSLANIRFNIARCYEQLERWPEALAAYEAYNALPDDAHRKERAWAATRKLREKVFATLSVSCFPAGASVRIAGVTNGEVGCPWQSKEVRPGNYVVEVGHPGYEAASREVLVVAGKAQNVKIELRAKPSASAAVTGAAPDLTATTVEPAAPTPVLPWAVIGGGAAALVAGGVFHGLALNDKDEAEELPPSEDRDDVVESFELKRNLAFVGYGVGAAGVVAGVVLLLLDGGGDAPDPEAVRLEPRSNGLVVVF